MQIVNNTDYLAYDNTVVRVVDQDADYVYFTTVYTTEVQRKSKHMFTLMCSPMCKQLHAVGLMQ